MGQRALTPRLNLRRVTSWRGASCRHAQLWTVRTPRNLFRFLESSKTSKWVRGFASDLVAGSACEVLDRSGGFELTMDPAKYGLEPAFLVSILSSLLVMK